MSNVQTNKCTFCFELNHASIEISDNDFIDNQDGFQFYKQHELERASQIFVHSPSNVTISGNTIVNRKNNFAQLARQKLPYFAAYLPSDYFDCLQSPLVRIKIRSGAENMLIPVQVIFEKNDFLANYLVQPWINTETSRFSGALLSINCESETTNADLHFNLNRFDDNFVRGGDAALIYVQGPSVKADSNIFFRSGSLDTFMYNNIDTHKQFPYKLNNFDDADWFEYQWTQSRGIFWLKGAVDKYKD